MDIYSADEYKRRMRRLKLTQGDVADALHYSRSYIAMILGSKAEVEEIEKKMWRLLANAEKARLKTYAEQSNDYGETGA